MFPKLYIGPVSKNIVDATIEVANEKQIKLGLIPSRRQVDYMGGYVGWNTKEFCSHVKERTDNVILERDHGGPGQGHSMDHGVQSLIEDAKYFDIIHIDTFKNWSSMKESADNTITHIQYLHNLNPNLMFEIGTEEGIRKYSVKEYSDFLKYVFDNLNETVKEQIKYLVVQGGTQVKSGKNIGFNNINHLEDFVNLCDDYGKLSKEHNGDYITTLEIKQKFEKGLSAINIAPEFGTIESETLMNFFSDGDKEKFFQLVKDSKRWVKWFDVGFVPEDNKEIVVKMCGHYVFELESFKKLKNQYSNADQMIISNLKNKILEIVDSI